MRELSDIVTSLLDRDGSCRDLILKGRHGQASGTCLSRWKAVLGKSQAQIKKGMFCLVPLETPSWPLRRIAVRGCPAMRGNVSVGKKQVATNPPSLVLNLA